MKAWFRAVLFLFLACASLLPVAAAEPLAAPAPAKVFIIPVRDDIMPPLVYLIRRGVKEAMEAKAELIILDMETDGGRVDTTQEIIEVLNQFPGKSATYVNRKAFSAGAFISVATEKIFMAPQSVIGAAAPILMTPGGTGTEEISKTVEAKMTSAIRGLVRAEAEKNGHNVEVVEAMIDTNKELIIDGKVLNAKGQILTLTNTEAEEEYGNPPKPLLSAGTVENLDQVAAKMGFPQAQTTTIVPTGVEQIASWINRISPVLLIIGMIGMYIEFKTPGFGLPGIASLIAFAIYFFGGYIAGLSGLEWAALFVLGVMLLILELFVFPGTLFLGLGGAVLILVSLVMAMVDVYPGMPSIPSMPQLTLPLLNLMYAALGTILLIGILSRVLPKTRMYRRMVSATASGDQAVQLQEAQHTTRVGWVGKTISPLRPGGKAQFGDFILDVISQGDLIPKGTPVKIIGHSGTEAVVKAVE